MAYPGSDWKTRAACKGIPLDDFFPPEGRESVKARAAREARAKAVCARCPVQVECLDWAVGDRSRKPEQLGILGGKTEEERAEDRRKYLRATQPKKPAPRRARKARAA